MTKRMETAELHYRFRDWHYESIAPKQLRVYASRLPLAGNTKDPVSSPTPGTTTQSGIWHVYSCMHSPSLESLRGRSTNPHSCSRRGAVFIGCSPGTSSRDGELHKPGWEVRVGPGSSLIKCMLIVPIWAAICEFDQNNSKKFRSSTEYF